MASNGSLDLGLALLNRAADKSDESRVTQGVGSIRQRTIELGNTVVAVNNIGSIRIVQAKRSWLFLIVGGLCVIAGLQLMQSNSTIGLLLLAVGGVLIFLNLTQKVEAWLSIGTCDGHRSLIVSKDLHFLGQLLDFIRTKVDTNNVAMQGDFNITNVIFNSNGGAILAGDNIDINMPGGSLALGAHASANTQNNGQF